MGVGSLVLGVGFSPAPRSGWGEVCDLGRRLLEAASGAHGTIVAGARAYHAVAVAPGLFSRSCAVGKEDEMSWRQLPLLTLVLLGLMLAAPLSSGDKGLWLSLAPSAALLSAAPAVGLPAEHSTLAPDRQGRPVVAGRTETNGSDKQLDAGAAPTGHSLGERWTSLQDPPGAALLQPITAFAAPRAPPA